MKTPIFLFILFFYIQFNVKASSIYEFSTPHSEQVLYIDNLQGIQYSGTIELIKSDRAITIYTFSSSVITEDTNGYFTNYISIYTLNERQKISIPYSQQYLIFSGSGYVSFGASSFSTIYINDKVEFKLPYELNNKYYQLSGSGNTIEISVSDTNIQVYVGSTYCNTKCIMKANSSTKINVINLSNAKYEKVKFFFVERKSKYIIGEETGDKVDYIVRQSFTFEVSSTLAKKYFDANEGILVVSGNPTILSFSYSNYVVKNDDYNSKLYYFKPYSTSISLNLETSSNEGTISVKGVKPTIIINFPSDDIVKYQINKGIGPQYLRINIDNNYDDYLEFSFGATIQWHQGTMFNNNALDENNKSISSIKISKEHAGKTFSAIYIKSYGYFSVKKLFNWIKVSEFQLKSFSVKRGEEAHFSFEGNSETIITFEKGYTGSNIEMFIFDSYYNINYNPKGKIYKNAIKTLSSWKEITVDRSKVYVVIRGKDSYSEYSDYISIRSSNIQLNNNKPLSFTSFNDYNYIVYSLEQKQGKHIVEILLNIDNNRLRISLYQNNDEMSYCSTKACKFPVNINNSNKYYIIIKNINIIVSSNTKLYILQREDVQYFTIDDRFVDQYFLFSFNYNFKLKEDYISQINSNKELAINYRSSSGLQSYNIKISFNGIDDYKLKNEENYGNKYNCFYLNLNNSNYMSEIIINVKGTWSENLFLSPQAISFTYGGPYTFKFPYDKIDEKVNDIGSNIYYRIINNNQNVNDKYLFSLPSEANLIKGRLFDDYGELNRHYMNTKMFILNKDFFKNDCEMVTVEFNGNYKMYISQLYYEKLNGEVIEIQDNRKYQTYELNFVNNKNVYYLGLYGQTMDLTCTYLDDEEKEVTIYYKDELNLFPVLPNENSLKITSNFFCLNNKYEMIKFTWNKNSRRNKNFTIFDPNLKQEILNYSKQDKFYIKSQIPKTIRLQATLEEQANIYRVVTKSYLNNETDLIINSNNNYKLKLSNRYTNVWEISKGESFYYEAKSDTNNLLFSKVLEGSIYKQIILNNDTSIIETGNNLLFKIELLKDSSDFDVIINNKKKFYWKVYQFNKNEIELRRLVLPILNEERNEENKNDAIINHYNPYYKKAERNLETYFALSYEQDLENPVDVTSEIKIVYNPRLIIVYPNLEIIPFQFLSDQYSTKYTLKKDRVSNLVLTFITYQVNTLRADISYENQRHYLDKVSLNEKYIQKIYDKELIDSEVEYIFEINKDNSSTLDQSKYSCVVFHYEYTDENVNVTEFQKYNKYLKIQKDNKEENKIYWNKLKNVEKYEIYIVNYEGFADKEYFDNDCYLSQLKNKGNSGVQIFETTNIFYELEKKTQHLLITVVGFDEKYKMRIVYDSFEFKYQKSYVLMIVLISVGSLLVIAGIILVVFLVLRKKNSFNNNNDYNVSMCETGHDNAEENIIN